MITAIKDWNNMLIKPQKMYIKNILWRISC